MAAAAAVAGQNLGANQPERSIRGVHVAAGIGLGVAAVLGVLFVTIPGRLLALFGMSDPVVVGMGTQLLAFLSVSGFFITVALDLHRRAPGDRRHALAALHLARLAGRRATRPLLPPSDDAPRCNPPTSGSRSCSATRRAAC